MNKTEFIQISSGEFGFTEAEQAKLHRAGEVIKAGGLVAFPTETVYGLGGDALNRESSRKIYAAKGRPSDNPLIVHITDMQDLPAIVECVPQTAVRLAEAFWPGPLTMILPKSDAVPLETTGGLNTVAVRMPSHPVARALIAQSGGYVAAPSANTSGKPSPTLAVYVAEDLDGRIDMIIDGGEVGIGLESTIVDLTVTPPQILRPGYITRQMLEQVLGDVAEDATLLQSQEDCGQAPKAPGMKYRHYAPAGELKIVRGTPEAVVEYINCRAAEERSAGEKVGVIGTAEELERYCADVVKSVGSRTDEETIARRLYAILREFDDEGVTKIYSEAFASEGLGQAIMNRLLKAAGHQMIDL
jgi:L-threonylcarbamoyladenylate synthase